MAASTLVWIDLEMTGISFVHDHILEIACVITDTELKPLDEPVSYVIKQPASRLEKMDEWCTKHHGQSGLIEASLNSTITEKHAEEQILELIKKHCKPQKAPLCGNSVWIDRLFLKTHMPELENYLYYRVIDVSSIKLLARSWCGIKSSEIKKKKAHRALDDIHESIAELAYYRQTIFKQV